MEHATNRMKPRLLLSFSNVFRRPILDFARLAHTFIKKLKQDQAKQFDPLAEKYNAPNATLKATLISPKVLAILKTEGRYKLDTDACNK